MSEFLSTVGFLFAIWLFLFGGIGFIEEHINAFVARRSKLRFEHERHKQRIELLQHTQNSVEMLVVDKELADDFSKRLNVAMEKEKNK